MINAKAGAVSTLTNFPKCATAKMSVVALSVLAMKSSAVIKWVVISMVIALKGNVKMSEQVTCPSCHGKGEGMGFACGTRCDYRAIKCFTCEGTGTVSQERLRLMELAEIVRKDRIARRLSIREEGKRLNVDFAEWSRIEGGRPPESEHGKRALNIRYGELGISSSYGA